MLIMDFVRFIFVAVILSLVSLLLMLLSHLVWISFSVWCLCWMTCSHRNTHIRWANSVSRICRSLTAPPSVCLPCCSSFGCWGWLMLMMPPHPRMIPSVISGHWGFSWGQCSFASFQIARTGVSRHVVSMCSIVSVVRHVGQSCLSSYPWMCVQKCPIFWVSCMALYRNCRIFIRMVGLCSPSHKVLSVPFVVCILLPRYVSFVGFLMLTVWRTAACVPVYLCTLLLVLATLVSPLAGRIPLGWLGLVCQVLSCLLPLWPVGHFPHFLDCRYVLLPIGRRLGLRVILGRRPLFRIGLRSSRVSSRYPPMFLGASLAHL